MMEYPAPHCGKNLKIKIFWEPGWNYRVSNTYIENSMTRHHANIVHICMGRDAVTSLISFDKDSDKANKEAWIRMKNNDNFLEVWIGRDCRIWRESE